MHDFFKKNGVAVMTIRELFDFIVDPCIADDAIDSYLKEVQQKIMSRGDITAEDEIADSVFVQMLKHVKNVEEDVIRLTSGATGDMYYKTITGLKQALSEVQQAATQQDSNLGEESSLNPAGHSNSPESESGSGNEDEENSSESEGSDSSSETKSQQVPIDKKAARKENKKKVKEEETEAWKN